MTFRNPSLLWLLAIVPPMAVFLIARERRRAEIARRFISDRLRGTANPARVLRPFAICLAAAGTILAMAGPYAGYTSVPVRGREANRVVAIDVSQSMGAEDVGTSRLSAAKGLARRLIADHNGRVGLIAFEGSAEVVSPLTNDTEAVLALLDTLQIGEVGEPGSDLGGAMLKAVRLAEIDPAAKADVVLISDGEDQGTRLNETLMRARTKGVRISAIVVGSPRGASIPTGEGVLRDESGQIVTTFANSEIMEKIASSTGGTLLENPFAEDALDILMARTVAVSARQREMRVPVDRYQWPLAFAFVALFSASLLNRGAE